MKKLSLDSKRQISGGAIISATSILVVHGILTLTWAILDIVNMVADNMPKHQDLPPRETFSLNGFDNSNSSSRNTIFS